MKTSGVEVATIEHAGNSDHCKHAQDHDHHDQFNQSEPKLLSATATRLVVIGTPPEIVKSHGIQRKKQINYCV